MQTSRLASFYLPVFSTPTLPGSSTSAKHQRKVHGQSGSVALELGMQPHGVMFWGSWDRLDRERVVFPQEQGGSVSSLEESVA